MEEIITGQEFPPIPTRKYDYYAIRSSYCGESVVGYGKTAEEAIKDLLEKEEENEKTK